jgi:hypothetical protein
LKFGHVISERPGRPYLSTSTAPFEALVTWEA